MKNNDYTTSPLNAEAISEAAYQISVAFNYVFHQTAEAIHNLSKSIELAVERINEKNNAQNWAAIWYPKWYHYAIYGKNHRIREKYIKRIIKLYREEIST